MADREFPPNIGFVLSLVIGFTVLAAYILSPFITYILLGTVTVYLLYPLHRRVTSWTKRPRVSGGIMLVIALIAILGPITYLVTEIVNETIAFREVDPETVVITIDGAITRLFEFVGIAPPEGRPGEVLLTSTLAFTQDYLSANAQDILTVAANLAIGAFILAFIVYYGLVDGHDFYEYVRAAIPLARDQLDLLAQESKKVVDAVLLGQILSALAQGALGAIGFLMFGVPNVFFWGFVMTILSVIPVLGAFLIWGPAALWLLAIGDVWQGLGLLLWGAIVVSNIDNVLKPHLVGRHASIHPIVVVIGVFGGLAQFGFIGFLIGPLLLSLFIAIINFWTADFLPLYRPRDGPPTETPTESPGPSD